jgi:lipopolysaccharide/colanic/teichoic acid biosynthesis glycosyltransferase
MFMRSEVYPRTSMKPANYKRFLKPISEKVEGHSSAVSFLYIGNDTLRTKRISASFQYGLIAEHYFSARKVLENVVIRKDALPDVIFIDVPFSEADLAEFIGFLRESESFSQIPVIYSKKYVINGYKDRLRQIKLVDDIICLDSYTYNLVDKINFLKESKLYSLFYRVETEETLHSNYYKKCYYKRALDIVLASIALLILFPLFLVIAIAIKLESKGPVFYNSFRAGRGFRIFKFYKFRTMEIDADKKLAKLVHLNQYNNSKFFKVQNDPRVTRLGAFLRKTSLDEFPQLLNVLKGDMSIVGNRPLPLYEAAALTTNDSIERFMAPAGMTGLWQIMKRGREDMSTEERINLDIAYARKHNLAYDLWIMANTPGALFQKTNV